MTIPTRSLFVQWIVLFSLVSYAHSSCLNLSLSSISGFNSEFKDILILGAIFLVISLAISLPPLLFIAFLIRYSKASRKFLIQINAITLIFGTVIFFWISYLTVSYFEGFVYVASYFLVFLIVINFYILMWKRENQEK